ncbi:hypothetical protein [Flavihumibacter petaseus]|nr:hypothetical protein [Flavihumibacter petaseus]
MGERILLDPYSKLTSTWASLAQAYLTKGQPDSAKWAFREGKRRGGFIEPVLSISRQLLNSCHKNAILVTYGDIITFPAWYLQTIEQYRTDITVVDATLLNTVWYPQFLKQEKKLKMGYANDQLDTLSYALWSPQRITIPNPRFAGKAVSWTMNATYYGEYVLRGDRILLDIFRKNMFDRDLYFSSGADTSINLFLTDYIVDDGLVDLVLTDKNDINDPRAILSENLSAYTIKYLNKSDIRRSPDAVSLLNLYRSTYCTNIGFLLSKGKTAEAKKLLKEMDERFPLSILPYSYMENNIEELRQKLK